MDEYQEKTQVEMIGGACRALGSVEKKLMSPTLIERYQYNLSEAEKRVSRLKRLLELLDRNPEIKEVLELTQNL